MADKKYILGVASVTDKKGVTRDQFIFVSKPDGSKEKVENKLSGTLFDASVLKEYLKKGVLIDPSKKSNNGGGGTETP